MKQTQIGEKPKIAVVLPCYNEEKTIAKVISDARIYLPKADVYVFDNNSSDKTKEIAESMGIVVLPVPRQGKGFAVRAIMEKINANIFVMVDGDDTYDFSCAPKLVESVLNGECDMAVGARLSLHHQEAFSGLHLFGNYLVRWLINKLFGSKLSDIMSGFRVFTKDVAKKVPLVSQGFEVETEWTVQLMNQGYHIKEIDTPYKSRIEGSNSKLRTLPDGFKVLWTIFKLFKDIKPLTFFGGIALSFFFASVAIGFVLILQAGPQNWENGQFFWMGLSVLLLLISTLLMCVGIILNSMAEKQNQILSVLKKL